MPKYEIQKLSLKDEIVLDLIYPLVRQLRPHLTPDSFRSHIKAMTQEKYELWAYVENQIIQGVVSARMVTDLVRGPHMYIDDLVIENAYRSKGIGAVLLKHMEDYSKKLGLPTLRLCCALENEGALKFYKREGWAERAYALVKKV